MFVTYSTLRTILHYVHIKKNNRRKRVIIHFCAHCSVPDKKAPQSVGKCM